VLVFLYRYFHSCRCNCSSVFVCFVWLLSQMSLQPFVHLKPFSSSFLWVPSHSCRYSWLNNLIAPVIFVRLFCSSHSCRYNHSSKLIAPVISLFVHSFGFSHSRRYNWSSSLIALSSSFIHSFGFLLTAVVTKLLLQLVE